VEEARAGKGHRHYEGGFEQVVWRVGFESHLAELARAARGPVRTGDEGQAD
jgi:hypothetical protein